MRLAKTFMAVAAATLAAAPVVAAPVNPAAKLSIGAPAVRASTHAGKNKLVGPVLIAIIAVAAVGVGIAVAADSNDDAASS